MTDFCKHIVPWLFSLALLAGCVPAPEPKYFPADNYPDRLSEWGLVAWSGEVLTLANDSHVYDLNTALFTDYALKLRTIYIPPGGAASFDHYEAFGFPTGSIISKTFFYQTDATGAVLLDASWDGNPASVGDTAVRLMETRLLVKHEDGWDALPYVWRGDDAYLSITGDLISLQASNTDDLNYLVPSRNQCTNCHATNHTTGDIQPIGIKARHLNRPDPVTHVNQLSLLQTHGQLLDLPPMSQIDSNAPMNDDKASLDARARAYLDINCGHCHNAEGAADTSGLLLDKEVTDMAALGTCKAPIAAGRGSGGHFYSIVPGSAATSILAYRMSTTDPGTMMPELGRTLVHQQGLSLISAWIDSLSGQCI